MSAHPLAPTDPRRRQEISEYMTAHLWVAQYKPEMDAWFMMKEPFIYSRGPFEVIAVGKTLEEAFDKARGSTQA